MRLGSTLPPTQSQRFDRLVFTRDTPHKMRKVPVCSVFSLIRTPISISTPGDRVTGGGVFLLRPVTSRPKALGSFRLRDDGREVRRHGWDGGSRGCVEGRSSGEEGGGWTSVGFFPSRPTPVASGSRNTDRKESGPCPPYKIHRGGGSPRGCGVSSRSLVAPEGRWGDG